MKKKTQYFTDPKREWLLIDAKGQILGRLAARIAKILTGRDKATYTPTILCGNKVVVINVKYIQVTGKKLNDKIYDKFTNYPSGRKTITMKDLADKNPVKSLYLAVKGMLPKGRLGRQMVRFMKLYPEAAHQQTAQKPKQIEV